MSARAFLAGIIAADLGVVLFCLFSADGGRTMATLTLVGIGCAVLWPERF